LIVYYDHFLNTTVPTELIVKISFRCANAQTKYPQYVTWVRGLEDMLISDPKCHRLRGLRWGRARDVLVVLRRDCRMQDAHGYESETDGGWVPGPETKRQAECMRQNTGRLMFEQMDPRTETSRRFCRCESDAGSGA